MTVPDRRDSPGGGLFVLMAGWPGSGKSTLAAALAPRLGLPLLAKDEIKEALMDALGYPQTVADSQRLGQAAVLAMLRVARRCPGAVLDSTWFDYARPAARALPGRLVEVRCTVPRDVAKARYQARASRRHAGHLDAMRGDEELWGESPRSLGLGPVVMSIPPARSTCASSSPGWTGCCHLIEPRRRGSRRNPVASRVCGGSS